MNITHYYTINDLTGFYELYTNDDILVATFATYEDLQVFAQASEKVGTITSSN